MNSNRKRRTEALQDSPETTMPSQKRRTEEQQVYENGVLRALVVENFMNHKHLRVDFVRCRDCSTACCGELQMRRMLL